jgi:hypothetical protein
MDQRRKFVPTSSPVRPKAMVRSSSQPAVEEEVPAVETSSAVPAPTDSQPKREHRSRRTNWLSRQARTNYFIHLLVNDGRLRWSLLGVFLLAALYVGFFARIWIIAPAEVPQELRLRTTDLVQVWSLKRTGRQAAATDRNADAVHAFQGAVSINRYDLEANREMIREVTRATQFQPSWVLMSAFQLETVLAISHTNAADLQLAAMFYTRYELYDWATTKFRDESMVKTPEAALLVLKLFFNAENWKGLQIFWERQNAVLKSLPEAQLIYWTGLAMSGEAEANRKALDSLREAAFNPANPDRPAALHLLLRVEAQRLELGRTRKAFAALEDLHADRLEDHLYLAQALDGGGLGDEARKMVRDVTRRPESVMAAELQLKVWGQIGLEEQVIEFVHKRLPEFNFHHRLLLASTPLIVKTRKWDELRSLAVLLRQYPRIGEILGAYGDYLDGLAELGVGNSTKADQLFQRLIKRPVRFVPGLLQVATDLVNAGFGVTAAKMLDAANADFGELTQAWMQVEAAAVAGHELSLLIKAAERMHQLRPNDPTVQNNYAAVLLMTRHRADEAIRITHRLITDFPNLLGPRINHAVALIQLGRVEEAEKLIEPLDFNSLPGKERTACYFAWTLCQAMLGKTDHARLGNQRIDRGQLFPEQILWLEEVLSRLPPESHK